ncbi:parallel beta-helix repeat protein [Cytobacillus eiseniae]|uniref:Parallel beta-helix repeat protein n=1 Tax=Cytobacillus eiseniae TaxID=762947 RepID=A0ABS4R9U1_9BACI|nr:NosD domain-containing protein [Cytobacillus eiseniae]MBP2239668.1 parallel beta-helix repeat protein [Cytobacillus eiseniae]
MYNKIVFLLLLLWVGFTGRTYAEELIVKNSSELEQALNTQSAEVIKMVPGIYEGIFNIKYPVHLIGEEGVKLVGPYNGDVLTIDADDVVVEGLHIEGSGSQNAGIYVKGNRSIIHQNIIKNAFHGIYAKESYGHRIENNVVTSFDDKKKHKGYGIYVVKAPNSSIVSNYVYDTQDGVYVSYSDFCEVRANKMIKARYGVHTMDSKSVLISQNEVRESVNGLMIMQSNEVSIINNFFYLNTKIDGAGMFIFDTFDSKVSSNMMNGNFKGIIMENAKRNTLEFNTFIGNNTGLELGEATDGNTIYLNNFYHNTRQIISEKDQENQFNLDNYGNYYDDHGSLNLNKDHLVDFAYKSGDVFYNMTRKEPVLNIFYQSPAVELWNMIEQYTPMPSDSFIIDDSPLVKPAPVSWNEQKTEKSFLSNPTFDWIQIFCFLVILTSSVYILLKFGRERHEI